MTNHVWPADFTARWCRRLLRVAALLVPLGDRPEWLDEWEGELWQLLSKEGGKTELALFLSGAYWHGIWEWKEGWRVDSILQDTKFAFRTLARSPGFTLVAVAMLAISIGANTALFSVLEEAVLAEPPFPEPERLVVVDQLFGMDDSEEMNTSQWSYPRYLALRDEVRSVQDLAGYGLRSMTMTELGDPTVVSVETATPSLFSLLGVTPVQGRVFGPQEEDNGAANLVALVSHSFWQNQLGGSASAVGEILTLDGLRFQIVGVASEGFDGITGGAQLWIPFSALREIENASAIEDAWNQHFYVLGRLAPGATVASARSETDAFAATLMERFPPPVGASRIVPAVDVVPFAEARMNPVAVTSMLALFGAVLLVLLIAVANLAGLLMARGATRAREAAIRASLGAGRTRLLRQLLTESLTLAIMGGLIGVAMAWVGIDVLGAWLGDALGTGGARGIEYFDTSALAINWKVMTFAVVLTGGVGIAFGLLPAWQAARTDPNQALKGGAPGGSRTSLSGALGRDGLIVAQVAVAMVLLVGASIMMRSMVNLERVDPGFDPENLLTAMYSLSAADEQAGVEPSAFHIDALERIRALPGVVAATFGEIPMGGPVRHTIVLGSEGRPELTPAMHTWIRTQPVADGHFAALGGEIVEGRDIETTDDWNTQKVIVLSRMAADMLFPDGNPIGQRVQLSWAGFGGDGATVVGIVEPLQLDDPGQPEPPQGFVPLRQTSFLETGIMVRTAGDPEDLIPALLSAIAEIAPNLAVTSVMSMEQRAASTNARPRVVTMLLGVFGAVSLFLVAAGLYGTVAFAVARRTKELGLRASLGAGRGSILALVLRQGLGVTLVGIAVGVAGSLWGTRALESLLFDTGTFDPGALIGVSMTLFLVALVAAYVPARRAMRIDPMVALRTE